MFFKGIYFVLMGYLLLIDGIGFGEIGLDELEICIVDGLLKEVILVINFMVEGEVIVYYIV